MGNLVANVSGAFYVCMSYGELHSLWKAFTDAGGHWQGYIVWVKQRFTLGGSDYQHQSEPILHGLSAEEAAKLEGEQPDAESLPVLYGWTRHAWYGGRKQGDAWFFDRPMKSPEHPTMKPVRLCAKAIVNSCPTDGMPDERALVEVLARTQRAEPPLPEPVVGGPEVEALIAEARQVQIAEPLLLQVARVVRATDPRGPGATDSARRNLRLGASPRGGEAICRVARVAALRAGRSYVVAEDLAWALLPALRHRLLPSFEAEARGLTQDALVGDVLHDLPELPREVEQILAAIRA